MTLDRHKTDNQFYHIECLGWIKRSVPSKNNQGKVLDKK